jgi:glycerate 2-kinase
LIVHTMNIFANELTRVDISRLTDALNHPEYFLKCLFKTAVDAVSAEQCLPAFLPRPPKGHTLVLGAGKAAAAMAAVVEQHWASPLSGMVVTRYGHGQDCKKINVIEAAHPIPDDASERAASAMLQMCEGLTADDLVLCLISGGGSSLLALPAAGISLQQKQALSKAMLNSGATIKEINCVRKHLSAIKGGRLTLACGAAQVVTLLISDIPGDDPSMIASGPTFPDVTTCLDALNILKRYAISVPENIFKHLTTGAGETPKPDDPRLAKHRYHVVATAQMALEAAAACARSVGITPYILSDQIEGEARDIGLMHAAIAHQVSRHGQPFNAPCVLLSGGETTVTVRASGQGGRNTEFLLSLAQGLDSEAGIYALACDTDGIDGSGDNAGAWLKPDSLARAKMLGLSAKDFLDNNNAYQFFAQLGDLFITGPTRTNVNDFRAVLIL